MSPEATVVRLVVYAVLMAKVVVQFTCSECGATAGRWLGRCPGCGAFGTLVEELHGADGRPPSGQATKEAMDHILAACKKHRVAAGVHCGSAEEALARIEEGWQFLAIGSELKMMLTGAGQIIEKLGKREGRQEMAKY